MGSRPAPDNISLVTLPARSRDPKLIFPLPTLRVGEKIVAIHLIGQIESAGAIATVDVNLRRMTAAAADVH